MFELGEASRQKRPRGDGMDITFVAPSQQASKSSEEMFYGSYVDNSAKLISSVLTKQLF